MTGQHSFAVTLFPPLAIAAALHTALMLFAFRHAPIADHLGLGIWWLFLTVYRFVMQKYLEAPRELRGIVLLSAAFVIGQLIATILFAPIFPSLVGWLGALGMWIATYYQCVNVLSNGTKPESLMVIFETTGMTLLFTAAVVGSGAIVPSVLIHLCISLFLILIAMMRQRTLHTRIDTDSHENRANLLPPLILLAITLFAVIICVLISGSAARVLSQITAWLLQVVKDGAHLIGAFFFWLLSLFPPPTDSVDEEFFYVEPLPSGQAEQVSTDNGIVLYLLILAVAIGLVFCVLKVWRTVLLRGRSAARRTVQATVVKKSSLWESIKLFLAKIQQKIRFNLQYLRCRNTVPGLLVWIERRMRRKRMKRKQGETTSAFLLRVATSFPSCKEDLLFFSLQLDRYYFGAGSDLSPDDIHNLRKTLKHAFAQSHPTVEKKPRS